MPPIAIPILAGGALIGGGAFLGGATIGLLGIKGAALLSSSLILAGAGQVLSGIGNIFRKAPTVPVAALERFNPSLSTRAARKIVVGKGPMATDVRYIEPNGTDDEFVDAIIVLASHRCHSVLEIYLGSDLAWTLAGGVQAKFSGYLTVNVVLEGTSANSLPSGILGIWNSNSRLTGCCYLKLRIKRTGNSKNARSPLESGLPGTVRVIGEGLPMYDPRRDSTRGGSGSHRVGDQSTWQFYDGATDLGSNPYLQATTLALGWRVGGRVMVGAGLDADIDLDLDSTAAAANIADEAISLTGGGTQKRWQTAGIFTTAEGWRSWADKLMLHANGEVDDSSGRLRFLARHNDLAAPVLALTDDDVVGPAAYDVDVPLGPELYNAVRGQFSDPAARYEFRDYVGVEIASPDGIDRTEPLDLWMHTDGRMAQRLARLRLQRAQWPGVFTAPFGKRALQLNKWDVVSLDYGPLEFSAKLFRVAEAPEIEPLSGRVQLVLIEEDDAIYTGDGDEDAPVAVPAPVLFDARSTPPIPLDYDFVTGDGRPENGATRGENLQPNALMPLDTAGYNNGGGQWSPVDAPAGWPISGRVWQNNNANALAGTALEFPKVTIDENRNFHFSILAERTGAVSGIFVSLVEYEPDDTPIGPVDGTVLTPIPVGTGTAELFQGTGRASPGAGKVALYVTDYATAGSGTLRIGAPRVASSQIGADVTSDTLPRLDLPTVQAFNAAFDGTISAGQQPRTVQVRRFRGEQDVTTSTSWTVNGIGCSASVNSSGVVTINNVVASGLVEVTGTRDGVPLSGTIETRVDRAGAPAPSGSSSVSGDISFSTSSGSFVTALTASVTVPSGGSQVAIASQVTVFGDSGSVEFTEVVWQRETSPGTWADVGAVVSPTIDNVWGYTFGFASISRTVTGLSAGVQNFRLRVRRTSGSGNQNFSGSYSLSAT